MFNEVVKVLALGEQALEDLRMDILQKLEAIDGFLGLHLLATATEASLESILDPPWQDALLDKWMQDQVELREVFRLEREEARLERSEAQARQDILVTKLFEQNEVLSNLVMQQNEEIIRMKGVQGVGIGNGLGVGEYFRREVKSILMR